MCSTLNTPKIHPSTRKAQQYSWESGTKRDRDCGELQGNIIFPTKQDPLAGSRTESDLAIINSVSVTMVAQLAVYRSGIPKG